MNIVEFEQARFTYDGTTAALDGVNLHIEAGEFICVLGGNGSGKSTLAKHVNALLAPDEGSVRVLGRDTRDPQSIYFIRSNAGMVFQNPDDQIVASLIQDDVAFGPENLGIPLPELRDRVTHALEQVGLQGFETRETTALSGGQKQRVAIAGVLAMEPQILVLDEASAMLDPRGRAGLLRVCHELNDRGLTIVLITHFMEEAVGADRVVVLNAGRVALSGAPHEVLTQVERLKALKLDIPFAAQMSAALRDAGVSVAVHVQKDELEREVHELLQGKTGQAGRDEKAADDSLDAEAATAPLAGMTSATEVDASGATGPATEADAPALELANHSTVGAAHEACADRAAETSGDAAKEDGRPKAEPSLMQLENVSFTYESAPRKRRRSSSADQAKPTKWGNDPDERWALRNVSLEVRRGDFLGLAGHTGSGKSTLIQLAAGLMQPNDGRVLLNGIDLSRKKEARDARKAVGLVFQYPERQLFAATVFDDIAFGPRNLGLSNDEVELRAREALERVHLSLDEIRDRSPFTFSGGQQRRIAIAGVLAMDPDILIMDEPTAGLDPQSHEALLGLIAELHKERGLTVLFVSHNMDDLARLCNRVAILNQGQLVTEGTPTSVFADEAALKSIGLGVPHVLHLANALGIEAGAIVPTVTELARTIAELHRG